MKVAYIRRFFHDRNKTCKNDYIIIEKITNEETESKNFIKEMKER